MPPVPALSPSTAASALGRSLSGLVFLAACCFASVAVAQEADTRIAKPGAIGAAYVIAGENFDHLPGQVGDTGEGHGGTFFMTYRFNEWVASVVRGELVDGFEIQFAGDDVKTLLAQGSLGVRLYPAAPVTGVIDHRVEPYVEAVAGLGFGERNLGLASDQRDFGFIARFSAGAEIWITESIGLDLSALYHQPTGELIDWGYYGGSAGLLYRF